MSTILQSRSMNLSVFFRTSLLLMLLLASGSVCGSVSLWVGGAAAGPTDWRRDENWIGGVPGVGGDVIFDGGGEVWLSAPSARVRSLQALGTGSRAIIGSPILVESDSLVRIAQPTLISALGGTADAAVQGTITVDVGSYSGPTSIIRNVTGLTDLVKTGPGELVLERESFTGDLVLREGNLISQGSSSGGPLNGLIFEGGRFSHAGFSSSSRSVVVRSQGGEFFSETAVRLRDGISGDGTLVLSGGGDFYVERGIFGARVDVGNNPVTLTGGGQADSAFVITGSLRSDQPIALSGGVFSLGDGGSSGSIEAPIELYGELVLNRSDTFEITESISGGGELIMKGSGRTIIHEIDYVHRVLVENGQLDLQTTVPGRIDVVGGRAVVGFSEDSGFESAGVNGVGAELIKRGSAVVSGGEVALGPNGTFRLEEGIARVPMVQGEGASQVILDGGALESDLTDARINVADAAGRLIGGTHLGELTGSGTLRVEGLANLEFGSTREPVPGTFTGTVEIVGDVRIAGTTAFQNAARVTHSGPTSALEINNARIQNLESRHESTGIRFGDGVQLNYTTDFELFNVMRGTGFEKLGPGQVTIGGSLDINELRLSAGEVRLGPSLSIVTPFAVAFGDLSAATLMLTNDATLSEISGGGRVNLSNRTLTFTGSEGARTFEGTISGGGTIRFDDRLVPGPQTWRFSPAIDDASGIEIISGHVIMETGLRDGGSSFRPIRIERDGRLSVAGEIARGVDSEGTVTAIGDLVIGAGDSFWDREISGTLDLANHSVFLFADGFAVLSGDVRAAHGATLNSSKGILLFGDITATGHLDVRGDFLTAGRVNAVGAGKITFLGKVEGTGSFSGSIEFTDRFMPAPNVEFQGSVWFSESNLLLLTLEGPVGDPLVRVTGTVFADGRLDVRLGIAPPLVAGDQLQLFAAGAIAGAFDTVSLPTLGDGLRWDVNELYSTGTISVIPEPHLLALLGIAALLTLGPRLRSVVRHGRLHSKPAKLL